MKIYVVYTEENHIVVLEGAFRRKKHAKECMERLKKENEGSEDINIEFYEILLQ